MSSQTFYNDQKGKIVSFLGKADTHATSCNLTSDGPLLLAQWKYKCPSLISLRHTAVTLLVNLCSLQLIGPTTTQAY